MVRDFPEGFHALTPEPFGQIHVAYATQSCPREFQRVHRFEKFFAGCVPVVYCLPMKREFLLLFLSCVLAPSLRAIQFTPLSIEQLAEESALIVQATVLSKSCQRDSAGRIFTKVELEVADIWKGSLPTNRFTVVHAGA